MFACTGVFHDLISLQENTYRQTGGCLNVCLVNQRYKCYIMQNTYPGKQADRQM